MACTRIGGRYGLARVIPVTLAIACGLAACGPAQYATGNGPASPEGSSCEMVSGVPDAVSSQLGLDRGFYARYCSVYGIPVLGSALVSDAVLQQVGSIAEVVLGDRKDVLDAVHDRYLRIVVVATSRGEQLSDVPELAHLSSRENAAAGLGPDPIFPAVVVRDSVSVCRPVSVDPQVTPPFDTLVHELGHALLSMGLAFVDHALVSQLDAAYENARAGELWQLEVPDSVARRVNQPLPTDVYMMTDRDEYWAVSVAAWFGVKPLPIRYAIGTGPTGNPQLQLRTLVGRDALRERDPQLYDVLSAAFPTGAQFEHPCPEWLDTPIPAG